MEKAVTFFILLTFLSIIAIGSFYNKAVYLEKKNKKLKELILLTDPSVSNEQATSLSVKQWQEYVMEFPDEVK